MDLAELNCPACGWHTACTLPVMLQWLQKSGMLRRAEQPDPNIIRELFHRSGGKFTCGGCGAVGLNIDVPREEEEAWGTRRVCQVCRKPIPEERLEIFPNIQTCAACQDQDDRGEDRETPDFCPRCGDIMVVSSSRGGGMSRYKMRCPSCG